MKYWMMAAVLCGMQIQLAAQWESVKPMTVGPTQDAWHKTQSADTLQLPFEDGFYPTLRAEWQAGGVYAASHWSFDPLSVGAAVLDGVSANGQAYNPGHLGSDSLTDVLVSPFFDLSQSNQVVLSFYWQMGGHGDPCETQDSLRVDFWWPQDSTWRIAWGARGDVDPEDWQPAAIALPSGLQGESAVRFRIGRKAARAGAFDHMLIDYLEFAGNRTMSDTVISDPSWIQPVTSLTEYYQEVPWFHYVAGALEADSLETAYRRNGPAPVGGWQLNLGKYQWRDQNGSIIATRTQVPVVSNLIHNVATPLSVPLHQPNYTPTGPFAWDMNLWFDGENVGEMANDTLHIHQVFGDRYGLDDGLYERTYGVVQGSEPRFAQRFSFMYSDTLRGLDLAWTPSGDSWDGVTFQIGIWEEDSVGLPGDLVYLSGDYTAQVPYAGYDFQHYLLDTAFVVIPKTCFIGIVQSTGEALTLGLDMTHDVTKAFGDINGWYTSLVPGALAIRPWFRGVPATLSAEAPPTREAFKVVPNPSHGELWIPGYAGAWRASNMMGQVLAEGHCDGYIDLSEVAKGWVLLQFGTQVERVFLMP